MIRPFGLRDVLAVRWLQRTGIWLDLNHHLLGGRSALTTALMAPVPWVGTGLASYVWRTQDGSQGFVQMLKRPGHLEADILYLAPGIEQQPGSEQAWHRLLAFCIQEAQHHRLRRLFVSLPEGAPEIGILATMGFAVYTNEDIYRLSMPPTDAAPPASAQIRLQRKEDAWRLRRLYSLYTPAPVKHAEGLNEKDEPMSMPLPWWELSRQVRYVLVEANEIQANLQIVSGRKGHWLLIHGDTGNRLHMTLLVQQALHELAGTRRPVYCTVRDYQGGLRDVLQEHGFELFTSRSRLVKHMTVSVKTPEPAAVPSMAVEQSP